MAGCMRNLSCRFSGLRRGWGGGANTCYLVWALYQLQAELLGGAGNSSNILNCRPQPDREERAATPAPRASGIQGNKGSGSRLQGSIFCWGHLRSYRTFFCRIRQNVGVEHPCPPAHVSVILRPLPPGKPRLFLWPHRELNDVPDDLNRQCDRTLQVPHSPRTMR